MSIKFEDIPTFHRDYDACNEYLESIDYYDMVEGHQFNLDHD